MTRPLLILIFCSVTATSVAKDRTIRISKRAIDMVSQKNGPMLLGAILDQQANGSVQIADSRNWLKNAQPELFAEQFAKEQAAGHGRIEKTLSRLDVWMKERATDVGLILILKPERRRLESLLKQGGNARAAQPQFFVLNVDARNIRRASRQPAAQRRIAAFAWHERLENIETRSAESLAKELIERRVRLDGEPPNLGDRLPARDESDEDWAVRQALFEYKFREPLDFQGTNGALFRTSRDNVDMTRLLGELLKGQLGNQLAGLLDPQAGRGRAATKDGLDQAKKVAKAGDIRGFRITKMKHDIAASSVTVSTDFYARSSDSKWKLVHAIKKQVDASKARDASQQQFRDDPRIKQVLGLVDQLGLPPTAVDTALKFGAATREGQDAVDDQFRQFLDRYIRKVDSPPVP